MCHYVAKYDDIIIKTLRLVYITHATFDTHHILTSSDVRTTRLTCVK